MRSPDDNWIERPGRNPPRELKAIQQRFRRVRRRSARRQTKEAHPDPSRLKYDLILLGCVPIVTAALYLGGDFVVTTIWNDYRNGHSGGVSGADGPPPRNCSEAWATFRAPAWQGSPNYAPHLDGDGDGVACEFSFRYLFD